MKKKISAIELSIVGIIIASVAVGIFLYPGLPERIPSHWNAAGEVDGYAPKPVGVFLVPGLMAFLFVLFYAVPRIDPLRANIEKFRPAYERFVLLTMIFLSLVYTHILLWSRGIEVNTTTVIVLGLAGLMFAVGTLCAHAKRNYFVGIRTPWTLQSDSVWEKTHRLGGKLFHYVSFVMALGVFVPQYMIYVIVVPVAILSLFLVGYSYVAYEREQKSIAR